MRGTLLKIACVGGLKWEEEQLLRLSVERGGCGIISACTKQSFAHLVSACQYMLAVGSFLVNLGWSRIDVETAIRWDGVY